MFHCSVIKDQFCIAVCLKQLCYYIMLFPACQELFSTFFLKLSLFLSCSNFDILSHPTGCCQELFHFFFTALCQTQLVYVITSFFRCQELFSSFLKFFFEGFQSDERRKRDLNPRAGFPTYTLSRGASSAS